MASDSETMQKLLSFASAHGVRAHRVSRKAFNALQHRGELEEAPFTSYLGIMWDDKRLYYTRSDHWAEAIHELGHLLASPNPPRKGSTEWDFFGWEVALVHHIGGSLDHWLASNKDYGVTDGSDLGALNPLELHTMLAERLVAAKTAGLLDQRGTPLAIR